MMRYDEVKEHLATHQYKWLVTGVAGFIGSNLLEHLLRLNQVVVGLDNLSTGKLDNITQAIEDSGCSAPDDLFTFVEGDVRDYETCHLVCEGVDKVLHQAALGSVPRSIADPISSSMSNVEGHLNMMTAAKENGIKSFVYAASSSTYGDHPALPKVEDVIGSPLSPYAVTKLVNELYADVFARCYQFNTVGLRYFNVFGKRQDPSGAYAAVIPKWIGAILAGDGISINGDGSSSRDFCYIDNVVQANMISSFYPGNHGAAVFNIAYGGSTDLNELKESIYSGLSSLGAPLGGRECTHLDFRQGDVRHSLADISSAREKIGYDPQHSFARGLGEVLEWYYSLYESDGPC